MTTTLLLPDFSHYAIEERYGNMQSELLLRRLSPDAPIRRHRPGQTAAEATESIESDLVLVVTDPLLLPRSDSFEMLRAALDGSLFATVPATNESEAEAQRRVAPKPYLTPRELEGAPAPAGDPVVVERWPLGDPGLFLARTADLRASSRALTQSLEGERVAVVPAAFCHRFPPHHANMRADLLERVSVDARRILEFGCGEGALGGALKARQPCRVVGIERDPESADVALGRLDAIHVGDVREVIESLDESFDWIVGGDIVEHLDDPWSFLQRLRRVAAPGARLLLSIPNSGNGAILGALLEGRFDYVYMGILSSGHVRVFTRRTIEDMLTISGWAIESIDVFPGPETVGTIAARRAAEAIGAHPGADLTALGFYVLAVNQ